MREFMDVRALASHGHAVVNDKKNTVSDQMESKG